MKNLTQSLERVAFSFSALSMMSAIELLNLSPALASSKKYNGADANVTVTCDSVNQQSTGNFSIDGRKSGTGFVQAGGVAYFDNDPRSAQPISVTSLPTSVLSGSGYDHGLPAINFEALIEAVGEKPDGSPVISLPDLSENPDKAFGFTLDCPPIPTNAGGGGGDGGGDDCISGIPNCCSCTGANYGATEDLIAQGTVNPAPVQSANTVEAKTDSAKPLAIGVWQGATWAGKDAN